MTRKLVIPTAEDVSELLESIRSCGSGFYLYGEEQDGKHFVIVEEIGEDS